MPDGPGISLLSLPAPPVRRRFAPCESKALRGSKSCLELTDFQREVEEEDVANVRIELWVAGAGARFGLLFKCIMFLRTVTKH